jgi:hypothetical protein
LSEPTSKGKVEIIVNNKEEKAIEYVFIQDIQVNTQITNATYKDIYGREFLITSKDKGRETFENATWQQSIYADEKTANEGLSDLFKRTFEYLGSRIVVADPYFLGNIKINSVTNQFQPTDCQSAFINALIHSAIEKNVEQIYILGFWARAKSQVEKDDTQTASKTDQLFGNYEKLFQGTIHTNKLQNYFKPSSIQFLNAKEDFHNRYWFSVKNENGIDILDKCIIVTNSLGGISKTEVDFVNVEDKSQLEQIIRKRTGLFKNAETQIDNIMEELKKIISKTLSDKSEIDWLIVHTIHKSDPKITGVEFSFVDGKERQDEPFKTNQGFISLKKADNIENFKKIIGELSTKFKTNPVSLANLFIISTRASYTGEDDETLLNVFKEGIGKENCSIVFDLLIKSLNSVYHDDKNYIDKQPNDTNDWLTLFRSTQYLHRFSDPIISCLQLVRDERNRSIDFDLIQNMKPLLRAVLMGWYGYDLTISQATQDKICENENELTFLSACLIDDFSGERDLPNWLNSKLIELFVEKHWSKIGKPIFIHVFGISYRNKQENNLYKKLEELLHEILYKKLKY